MRVPLKVVYSILSADVDLSTQVGDRIYPQLLPQEPEYPCIMFDLLSTSPEHAFQDDVGVDTLNIDVVAYGRTALQAAQVGAVARSAISRKKGLHDGQVVSDTLVTDENVSYDDETKSYIHVVSADIFLGGS